MLRRGELLLWGQAGRARGEEEEEEEDEGCPWKDLGGGGGRRRRSGGWPPRRRRRGRLPGYFRPPPPRPEVPPSCCCCCFRSRRPRVLLSLRPANLGGRRGGCSEGMRAPRNTNQFLMGEKYRLMHLRSDSVGTEPGGGGGGGGGSSPECGESAGGVEPGCLDMEAYLEALENARGALLLGGAPPPAPPSSSGLPLEENSLPYFPSEDDLLQSQRFMERDFQQFCSTIA